MQKNVVKNASYVDKFANLSVLLGSGSNQLINQFELFQSGGADFEAIDQFLAPDVSDISTLISSLRNNNTALARSTFNNTLTVLGRAKERKSKISGLLQIAAGIITLLLYLLLVIPSIRRLSQDKETEVVVQKEAAGIMGTVSEGLFLLNKEHQIGTQQSAALKGMFKSERDLEGDFFDFIANYVPQSTVQIARDYLELLYGDRVKEKLVQDLNPLNEVEINIVRRDGSFDNRYLDFNFNRVMEGDRLSHILGSVTDVTRRVLLEKELEESKEEQEAQLELLMSILHVDNTQLTGFFGTAESALNDINNTFEQKGYGNHEIRSKISEIMSSVHRLKGDSAALGLHKFEFSAHALEEELERVTKENENITGKELLPAITLLKDLFGELENMQSLVDKFSGAVMASGNEGVSPLSTSAEAAPANAAPLDPLQQLAATVSERSGKKVNLVSYGLGEGEVPEELAEDVNSIVVQLIRNSIVHGCLTPEKRLAAGKSDFINIKTSFTEMDNNYVLTVRDDGEGFNEDKILAKALKNQLVDEDQAMDLDSKGILSLAFNAGFSTLDEADIDGGRGVGLDVVYGLIKDMGGKLTLRNGVGEYSQFQIVIPKK